MKNVSMILALTFVSYGIVGCAAIGRSTKALSQNFLNKKGKLAKGQYDINDSSKPQSGGSMDELRGMNRNKIIGELTPEEEIVWAPEDPNMPIIGLDQVLASDDKPVDSWYVDYRKALQASRTEGKPLMMWFTSSRNSPFDTALSNELFSTGKFESWAESHVVRLRIDSTVTGSTVAERSARADYVKTLKKRYKVMGHPVVLMLSPRGTVFGTYRGYKPGDSDFYYGRLRNSQRAAQGDYSDWKNDMEAKGYRVWHNLKGKSVFAKPSRYHAGTLWLVEPGGRKSVTNINKLALEDKLYIERKVAASKRK